jgi:uncharacterized protein YggE
MCGAQEVSVTLIESTGVGTVYAVPTHVHFWVHRELEGEKVEEAAARAEALVSELRVAIEATELPRAVLEASAPAVTELSKRRVLSSVSVRFPLQQYTEAEKAARTFGALCDTMLEVARTVEGTLSGPVLEAEDRDTLVNQAVLLATENAYPAAAAAAEALKSGFYSVDSVRIDAITWNETPGSEALEPNLRRVSCTASLRVVYAVTPKP